MPIVNNVSLGYSSLELSEMVDKELKTPKSMTPNELDYLHCNKNIWQAELVRMKKRTEFQLTSSRTRQFSLYKDRIHKQLTEIEYVDKLQVEKTWRCNAIRFVQQLESHISYVKTAA